MKKSLLFLTLISGFIISCYSSGTDVPAYTDQVSNTQTTGGNTDSGDTTGTANDMNTATTVTGGSDTVTSTTVTTDSKMTAAEQKAFLKTYIALGDSLSHGCQSLNVEQNRQYFSWPAQLARAMGTEFNQPLIEFPGVGMPNIEDAFRNGWFDTWSSTALKLVKCLLYWHRVDRYDGQARLNNFSMAGATIGDIISYNGNKKVTEITDNLLISMIGMMNPWICAVVGLVPANSKSALDQALDRDPTFITILIGNNDIIFGTIMGDDAKLLMTPMDMWKEYWDIMVAKIKAKSSVKGVLLITLPDNTDIPFLQTVPNKYCTVTDDANIPEGSKAPFFSTKVACVADVMTPDQIATVHNRVVAVNEIIRATAASEKWALLDIYTIVKTQLPGGMALRYADGKESSIKITADYATGGFFSLDGIHPTSTAYAHLANEAGKAINDFYGTSIPMIDEMAVYKQDSLLQNPVDPRDYPSQMGNMTYLFNTFVRIMAQVM